MLREFDLDATVIDMNLDAVRELRSRGVRAIYGDASQREILETAGVRDAVGLVFASNANALETVKAARELNPELTILTRATYLRDAAELQKVGATVVVSEAEVAFAMTEKMLRRLGATPEQIDRAREEVRADIDRHTGANA